MRSRVLPAFGDWPIGKVKPLDVRAWISSLEAAGLAPTTVRKAYQLLARVFDDAVEDGLLPITPCRNVRLPSEARPDPGALTPEDVEKLAGTVPERYRALLLLGAYSGLRWGELCGLRVDRVDMLRRRIDISEILVEVNGTLSFGPPKTAKSRGRIGFPPFLAELLAEHIARYPDSDRDRRLMFTSDEGTPLRRSNFRRRVWLPALERVGLPTATHFHALRHATASWLIHAGANPLEVAERLRHSRVTTTLQVYGHLFDGTDDRLDAMLEASRPNSRPSRGLNAVGGGT
jgi:integrase